MIAANTRKDKNADARKDKIAGATELPPDVKRGKNADTSALTCNQGGPAPSHLGVAGLTADGSLRLDSLLPRGGVPQKTPSTKGMGAAFPPGTFSWGGSSNGRLVNAFRGDHWRGLRRARPRQEASVVDPNRESPAAPSSRFSGWNGWCEWDEWKE